MKPKDKRGVGIKSIHKILCLLILGNVLVFACMTSHHRVLILQYDDFGPQAAAWELIGMQWWQWDSHGDSDPNTKYDIKVIVYRDIPLANIKKLYPVIKEKKQDYRYLEYAKAIDYLNDNIKENIIPEVTSTLQKTKHKIVLKLGNQK